MSHNVLKIHQLQVTLTVNIAEQANGRTSINIWYNWIQTGQDFESKEKGLYTTT